MATGPKTSGLKAGAVFGFDADFRALGFDVQPAV